MKRALVILGITAVMAGSSAGVAQAGPVDPLTENYISSSDVGPDKTDWWCVYNWRVDDVVCKYSPGVHNGTMRPVIRKSLDHWWNPWSWGR